MRSGHWYVLLSPHLILRTSQGGDVLSCLVGDRKLTALLIHLRCVSIPKLFPVGFLLPRSQCAGSCKECANGFDAVSVLWMFMRLQTIIFCIICCLMRLTKNILNLHVEKLLHTVSHWNLTVIWWEQIRKRKLTGDRNVFKFIWQRGLAARSSDAFWLYHFSPFLLTLPLKFQTRGRE